MISPKSTFFVYSVCMYVFRSPLHWCFGAKKAGKVHFVGGCGFSRHLSFSNEDVWALPCHVGCCPFWGWLFRELQVWHGLPHQGATSCPPKKVMSLVTPKWGFSLVSLGPGALVVEKKFCWREVCERVAAAREYEYSILVSIFFRVPQSNSGINSNKANSKHVFVLDPLFETGSFAR